MAKRSGTTKFGRVMNPADKERKKQRAQELKRNKKQRTIVRHAIVKGRDPEELLDQLRKLDDQEFDPNCELSQHVIIEKRSKFRGAYIQQLSLYRQEKNLNQVSRLESLLHDYETDRLRKEQEYQAIKFSEVTNLGRIPLPAADAAGPNAAMTPFMPLPPQPPRFGATKPGILKNTFNVETNKTPPGPPCGIPPEFDDDIGSTQNRRVQFSERVKHVGEDGDMDDDDLGPVAMPDSLLPPKPSFQPVRSLISAPPIPPNMAPPPPQNVPSHFSRYTDTHQRPLPPPPGAVMSAPPQPSQNTVPKSTTAGVAVLSAEPQLRNLRKEATLFMPTALQVQRPSTVVTTNKVSRTTTANALFTSVGQQSRKFKPQSNKQPARSADEACEEFLREIQDLF